MEIALNPDCAARNVSYFQAEHKMYSSRVFTPKAAKAYLSTQVLDCSMLTPAFKM